MFLFPFSTLHELNLDWILAKMKYLLGVEEENKEKADYAVETAEQALTVAEQAAQAQIGDGAVTTQKLHDNAVTTQKIANNSVTYAKLASDAKFIAPKIKKWDVATCGKIIFLGNSYGKNDNYPSITTFPEYVASFLNLGAEGTNWINLCRPSYSLVGYEGSGTFQGILQTWCEAHPTLTDSIGAVIVVAGINDARTSRIPYVDDAFRTLANYIKANLPNAVMYNGFCGWIDESRKASTDTHGAGNERFQVAKLYMNATKYGWRYMSGIENVFHCKDDMIDYVHPNNNGQIKIAGAICSFITGGGIAAAMGDTTIIQPTGTTVNNVSSNVNNGGFRQWVENNIIKTMYESLEFVFSAALAMNVNTVYHVGDVDLPYSNNLDFGNIAFFIRTDTDTAGVTLMIARVFLTPATDESGKAAINFQVKGYADGTTSKNVTRLIRFVAPCYKFTIED